jgi:hypothetical protein
LLSIIIIVGSIFVLPVLHFLKEEHSFMHIICQCILIIFILIPGIRKAFLSRKKLLRNPVLQLEKLSLGVSLRFFVLFYDIFQLITLSITNAILHSPPPFFISDSSFLSFFDYLKGTNNQYEIFSFYFSIFLVALLFSSLVGLRFICEKDAQAKSSVPSILSNNLFFFICLSFSRYLGISFDHQNPIQLSSFVMLSIFLLLSVSTITSDRFIVVHEPTHVFIRFPMCYTIVKNSFILLFTVLVAFCKENFWISYINIVLILFMMAWNLSFKYFFGERPCTLQIYNLIYVYGLVLAIFVNLFDALLYHESITWTFAGIMVCYSVGVFLFATFVTAFANSSIQKRDTETLESFKRFSIVRDRLLSHLEALRNANAFFPGYDPLRHFDILRQSYDPHVISREMESLCYSIRLEHFNPSFLHSREMWHSLLKQLDSISVLDDCFDQLSDIASELLTGVVLELPVLDASSVSSWDPRLQYLLSGLRTVSPGLRSASWFITCNSSTYYADYMVHLSRLLSYCETLVSHLFSSPHHVLRVHISSGGHRL